MPEPVPSRPHPPLQINSFANPAMPERDLQGLAGQINEVRKQLMQTLETGSVPLSEVRRFNDLLGTNHTRLRQELESSPRIHERDFRQLRSGCYRSWGDGRCCYDELIVGEALLRMAGKRHDMPLTIVEFGGGITIPHSFHIGAPHIARALAKCAPGGVTVHCFEKTIEGNYPEIEDTLFNLKVHTCGWEEAESKLDGQKCDLIFARHLYPISQASEGEAVAACARSIMADNGCMYLNFDVDKHSTDPTQVERYRHYMEGQFLSESLGLPKMLEFVGREDFNKEIEQNWHSFLTDEQRNVVQEALQSFIYVAVAQQDRRALKPRAHFVEELCKEFQLDKETIDAAIRALLRGNSLAQNPQTCCLKLPRRRQ